MLTKSISWFREEKVCDDLDFSDFITCYRPYNKNLLDATAPYARIIVQVLTVLVLILCVLCYKIRSLARTFIFLEIFVQATTMFYPNSNRAWAGDSVITIESVSYIAIYYCGSMRSFYLAMAHMTFALFFNRHVAYLEPLKGSEIAGKIILISSFFFVFAFMVTGIDNMAKMHKQLKLTNS